MVPIFAQDMYVPTMADDPVDVIASSLTLKGGNSGDESRIDTHWSKLYVGYTPRWRCITGLNYVTIAYLEAHKPCCAIKLLGLAQKSPIAR